MDTMLSATKQVESYDLFARPIMADDLDRLHELSIAVNWPHRPEDWEVVIALGHGIVACDEIGRMMGVAMWFPMGEDFATVGMVITSPRLQTQGTGRWLMAHVLREVGQRDLMLNATRAAYRLYASLGFMPGRTVFQHQGIAVETVPSAAGPARPATPADEAGIRALDAAAFGAVRTAVLDRLLPVSAGTVIERGGKVAGYALCRRFGRGHVIGPVVAAGSAEAVALAAPHVAAHRGDFLRVDTREEAGPFRDFLLRSGLAAHDTVTTMSFGTPRAEHPLATVFGLANQALS